MSGNEAALGIDLGYCPLHRKAMSEARDRGIRMATRPVVPVRSEQSAKTDNLILIPVDPGTAPSAAVEQGSVNSIGFALVVVYMAKTVNAALASRDRALFLVEFRATTAPDVTTEFESVITSTFSAGDAPIVFTSSLGGRSWEIALTPSVNLRPRDSVSPVWLVLVSGILCSIIAAVFHRRGERATRRLTEEIALRCAQKKSAAEDNRALVEGVNDGVLGLSADVHVSLMNVHARRRSGLPWEVIDRPFDSVMRETGTTAINIFDA